MSGVISVTAEEFAEIKRKLTMRMEASLKKKLEKYVISEDSSFSSEEEEESPKNSPKVASSLQARASIILPPPLTKEKLAPIKKTRIRRQPPKEVTLPDGSVKKYTSEGSALLSICISKTYKNYKEKIPAENRITWNEFRKRFSTYWQVTTPAERVACAQEGLELDWSKFTKTPTTESSVD